MLSRDGSRYPPAGTRLLSLGDKIAKAKAAGNFKASNRVDFLNDWEYQLGAEILVPAGVFLARAKSNPTATTIRD